MSHTGPDASYLPQDHSSPAYTWSSSPEPLPIHYRVSHLHPLMSYRDWSIGTPSQSNATIADSAPLSYESSALAYVDVSDITADMNLERSAAAISLDEHALAPEDCLSGGASPRAPRRTARRPNPVVVPNLTKKARGRPVPTKDTLLKPGSGRAYACLVEDCRKVFTRAEHLKRHTRSIHTNEKPFKCDELNCGRLFTRHDNLLQHLKNHRSAAPTRDASVEYGPLDRVHVAHTSPEPVVTDSAHVSPSMGVLIPPSLPQIPVSFNSESMQQYEVVGYGGDLSPAIGDASSSDGTPGPSESAYLNYNYGYPWPQSDIRSAPQATYAMVAENRYSHAVRQEFAGTAGAYAFHA